MMVRISSVFLYYGCCYCWFSWRILFAANVSYSISAMLKQCSGTRHFNRERLSPYFMIIWGVGSRLAVPTKTLTSYPFYIRTFQQNTLSCMCIWRDGARLVVPTKTLWAGLPTRPLPILYSYMIAYSPLRIKPLGLGCHQNSLTIVCSYE